MNFNTTNWVSTSRPALAGIPILKSACLFLYLLSFSGIGYAGNYFNSNAQGVAIGGYDPVAYFVLKMAVQGTDAHQTDWQGVTWYFSNEKHKDMFSSDPEGFAPKFGGWCAMAMTGGQVAEVDFDNGWTVDATGLYFNVNKDVRLRWLRGYNRNVRKGNENWLETRRAIEQGSATIHRRAQMPTYYNE